MQYLRLYLQYYEVIAMTIIIIFYSNSIGDGEKRERLTRAAVQRNDVLS